MKSIIINLPEFASAYGLKDIYGASVACMDMNQNFMEQMKPQAMSVNFYSIALMIYGSADYDFNGRQVHVDMNDLLVIPPHRFTHFRNCSPRAAGFHLLVEQVYFEDMLNMDDNLRGSIPREIFDTFPLFHLDDSKAAEFYELYRQIRKAIQQPHIYKGEMVKYLVHIVQLFLAELLYGETVSTHDLKHKENIFKIFIHLATQNYRKERQVKFYADKMNITTTYLSRTVREVSGNTVLNYLSSFLYNEICRLLKTTPMSINEIALELNFNDQSALTNFFKSKSGMSPLTYRRQKPDTP